MSHATANGVKRAIIADDHAMLRAGMRHTLSSIGLIEVVAEASNGREAIELVREHKPDLLMLDIGMPEMQGTEAFNEIRRWTPETRVIICTGLTAVGLLSELISAGVDGLFLKRGDPQHLVAAIPLILANQKVVSPDVLNLLEGKLRGSQLTPRELQILSLLVTGASNRVVGERLGVSVKTVDNHRTNLMRKLGVHSQAELISHALREGLLDSQKEL